MAILLTQSAIDRIKNYTDKSEQSVSVRVGVKKTGCNGYAYVINYTDEINEVDKIFDNDGVKVIVDEFSLCLLYTSPSPRDRG